MPPDCALAAAGLAGACFPTALRCAFVHPGDLSMPFSMYSASVPVFQHMLRNLSHLLDKAVANAEARKFDPSVLVNFRLAPDMLPFTKQIQIACDAAKLAVSRIAGIDAPKFEDTETTFADLNARIQKPLDFLSTVPAAKLEGTENKEVTIPVGRDKTRT